MCAAGEASGRSAAQPRDVTEVTEVTEVTARVTSVAPCLAVMAPTR